MIRTDLRLAWGLSIGLAIAGVTIIGLRFAEPLYATSTPHELSPVQAEYQQPFSTPFPAENLYTEAKARLGKTLFLTPGFRGQMSSLAGRATIRVLPGVMACRGQSATI